MESSIEQTDDDGCRDPNVAEEVQHLDVGDETVRRRHEVLERGCRHDTDDCNEEAEQQVFQAAQWNVEPAREPQVATEDAATELPEEFRERANRAEPGAEGLFQQEAHQHEADEEEHGGGMDLPAQAR